MSLHTRRDFLRTSSAGFLAAALLRPAALLAQPLGLPVGLQLYSVRDLLPKDYEGTLHKIAALGYQEVEAAGFFHKTAQEVKSAMQSAGLRCVSGHYSSDALHQGIDEIIAFHQALGAHYVICSSPGFKDSVHTKHGSPLTLDDWRWNADDFNKMGQKVKSAGLQFGYHNHTTEFGRLEGVVPFDELLRRTDASLVTMEMDCGWVTVGGGDPIAYLRQHPTRFSMLHVKDFKHVDRPASAKEPPPAAELGKGTIDFRAIFQAASKANIKHYFIEQEEYDMPPFEALKIDADYMKHLTV